jgi:hypothetical protein
LMVALPCESQDMYYRDIQEGYLQRFANKNIPVFMTSCATREERFLATMPIGAAERKSVELSWSNGYRLDPALFNIATFAVSGQAELRDMMQGGLGTRQLNEETLRYLIH